MARSLFFGFIFSFFICSIIYPQYYDNYICPEVQVNKGAQEAQTGGIYKPASNAPGQYSRVLFVFAQFSGDNRTFHDWTYGQLPNYANQLVDSVTSSNYRALTLSDYWKTMARGNYDIIGDVYPNVITLRSENWYQSNGKYFQDANKDVLDSINGKVDFKKYDNWGLNTRSNSFVFNARNGDGYLDMMYVIYRNPSKDWFDNFDGIAMLGDNFTFNTNDGIIIDGNSLGHKASGITIRRGAGIYYPDYLVKILGHELGHYLFGSAHTLMGGIMGDRAITRTTALSGWEMERLGYIAYTTATQDNYTITLQDLITSGQVLKIPIPNTSSDYYLVENHQRLNKYDQIMRGGSIGGLFDTTTNLGKGIYIWLIKYGNYYPPYVDIKTANGNWNWSFAGTINMPSGWPLVMPLSGRTSVNRDLGKSDRHPLNVYWYDGYESNWWEKWHDTIQSTKQLALTRTIMGLETHPFNYNYNRLFTPWSSPSTFVDGATNLSMQIFSESGNNITLKVFNTYNSSLSLPPSKPQFLKVKPSPNNHPLLTWTANVEPDLINYKIYKKIIDEWGWQYLATTSSTFYEDFTENYLTAGQQGFAHNVGYRITAVDNQSLESIPSDNVIETVAGAFLDKKGTNELLPDKPTEYSLQQNYPNPFNPVTTISYQIKEQGIVLLKVFDLLGQEVATLVREVKPEGKYSFNFDASNLPSGVYIYSLRVNDFVQNQKMTLLK